VSDERASAPPLVELGLGLAWLVGTAAALQIVERVFPPASLGTPIVGALIVDLAVSRSGVRWYAPGEEQAPDLGLVARRVAVGAGVALAVGTVVVGAGAPLHWYHAHGAARPSLAVLFALVRAVAVSARDELLYRGLPLLVAARIGVSAPSARVFAALAGGAAIALLPGVAPAAVVLAVASGWLFAGLWQRDGGAFAAVGAHAAWLLLFGSILHGGLFEIEWSSAGNIAVGNGSSGLPAWVAAAVCVVAGALLPRLRWPGKGEVKA
jgi:membrane protease YdiL (CAAX protease family)